MADLVRTVAEGARAPETGERAGPTDDVGRVAGLRLPVGLRPPTGRRAGVVERLARAIILGSLRRVGQGCLSVRTPDGSLHRFAGAEAGPEATITIHDPRFFRRMLLDGEIGAGEAYIRGEWSADSPMDVVRLGILNRRFLRPLVPLLWPAAAMAWLAHRARSNTVSGSRRNITKHYDLGNEVFALFLDASMTYSSAYFDEDVLAADARGAWAGGLCGAVAGEPGAAGARCSGPRSLQNRHGDTRKGPAGQIPTPGDQGGPSSGV